MPETLNGIYERLVEVEKKIENERQARKDSQKNNDLKFDSINSKLNEAERKFDRIDNRLDWQEREVSEIKEDLKGIKGDTTWLRRTITTALIGTVSTGVIGGAIALIYSLIGTGG